MMTLMSCKKFLITILALAGGVFFYGCSKEAEQPIPVAPQKATLIVEVMHHQWTIPDIPVYVKRDAIEFPGKDISLYDIHQITNQAGSVQFSGLPYGNYYLYVCGWDPVFMDSVIGYKPVVINGTSASGGIMDDRIFVSE